MSASIIKTSAVIFALTIMVNNSAANPAVKVAARYWDEVAGAMAKISGRELAGSAARKALTAQLRTAAAKHGDDIIKAARYGGVELAEAAAKHGDDVWKFAVKCPAGARQLALHTDELLPLARRIGPEVLELEARKPGIARRIFQEFGDDGIRALSKAPAKDLPVLAGYAAKADSPAARSLLLEYYGKTGGKILKKLNWKTIAASGLSVAVITAAYKTADSAGEALETMAEKNPETIKDIMTNGFNRITAPIVWPLTIFGSAIALVLGAVIAVRLAWPLMRRTKPGTGRNPARPASANAPNPWKRGK